MFRKTLTALVSIFLIAAVLTGCGAAEGVAEEEPVTLTLAAAASLKNVMDDEILPAFKEAYPHITVQPTYDASGKLQSQIESGAPVDLFISASLFNMEALRSKGLILEDSVENLLENKLVLIVPARSQKGMSTFADILKGDKIAIGDPASVPAGKYAKEALISLKLWDGVQAKASLGTSVTEVLNWVAEGSADAGVVYATDARTTARVKVVAEAPAGSVSQVLYPIGIIKASANAEAAKDLIEYLKGEAAMKAFEKAGFIPAKMK